MEYFQSQDLMQRRCLPTRLYQSRLTTRFSLNPFDNYTLSLDDITVEYDTSFRNNVTVTEDGVFIITDDSRNAGLRLNVKLNQSAYENMLEGRDKQKPVNIPEIIEPKPATEPEASDNGMNGKDEAE